MTHRERLLAVLNKRHPDRVPWAPRLQLWYEAARRQGTLPARYRQMSVREIERELRLGTPARDGRVVAEALRGAEVTSRQEGGEVVTEHRTPVGVVRTRQRDSAELARAGIQGREMESPIKGAEDYPVVQYLVEHTELTPTYDEYAAYEREIGDDGVPMVSLGDVPMGTVLREYIGWNRAYLELYDNREQVERLWRARAELMREKVKLAAASPAKLFLLGVHFDSQMTPPPVFERYFLPDCQEYAQIFHDAGKVMACHADSDTSLLLPLIEEAGYDMAECFATAPMVRCTLEQARRAWGDRVIIWGGIPSVILCEPFDEAYFEAYMRTLFATIAPGDAFILGVADNVMPEAKIERVARVTEMVEEFGQYPVQV